MNKNHSKFVISVSQWNLEVVEVGTSPAESDHPNFTFFLMC